MKNKILIKKSPTTFLLDGSLKIFGDNLVSVVLFGSRARNNYNEYSDFDVIIVLEKEDYYDLSKLRREFLLTYEDSLDLNILTKEDIVQNFNHCTPLFATLLLGKRVLFDRNMFFKIQFDKFVRLMTSLDIKYCEGGKIWEMQKIAIDLEALL